MIPFDAGGAFHPTIPGQLRSHAVRGAAATLSGAALSLGLRVVGTVILARLLSPADFGVIAMVTTFSLLLMSFGVSGFSEAVIQPKEMNRLQASNLFWISGAIGLVLTIGLAASGGVLARFFRTPTLAAVTVATSISIFITALATIHSALLKRAMRFTAVSAIEVAGLVIYTVVTALLALRGYGYWALVAGIDAQALSTTVATLCVCTWLPGLPRRNVGTRSLLAFAFKVYGRFSTNYFARNFDNFLVGWKFDAVSLGFYKKAYDLFALSASQLTAPLNSVALSALSRLNNDPDRFRRYLANSLGIIAFAGMAVGADLTLVGKDMVRLVLGAKWSESGRIFELFGPGIGVMLLCSTVGWIHLSIGMPGRWFRWTIFETATTALSFVLALHWGVRGIAAAWSLSYWILLIPAFWYAGRPIGFGVSAFLGAVWRYAAASLLAGLITAAALRGTPFAVSPDGAGAALQGAMATSLFFLALYFCLVLLFYRSLAPLRQLAGLMRELVPSRKSTRAATEAV